MNFSSISSATLKLCFFISIMAAAFLLLFIFIAIPSANDKYVPAYPGDGLARPNSLSPLLQYSPSKTLHNIFGDGKTNAIFAITITLVNIFGHMLWDYFKEGKKAYRQRFCRFSLTEIQSATDKFHDRCVIGDGGFGKVYKGFINNGREMVAVKRLKFSSSQGEREFLAEIKILSRSRHDNLVSLIGCCEEPGEMILVYEYMTRGSLADHLFQRSKYNKNVSSSLSWTQRLNICIGAGRGLDYLHRVHGIIHRDVKSANILLDENFVAKVSDFGLARPETRNESQSGFSLNVKGTRGYLDPNYVSSGKPTRETDTYSFGVVLLEVLCGRPARDQRAQKDEEYLVTWAQANIRNGDVEKIINANLRGTISTESLNTFVKVAESCLHMEQNRRPTMGQVVEQLEVALEQQGCQQSRGVPVPSHEIVVTDEAVVLADSEKLNMHPTDEQNVESSSTDQQTNSTIENVDVRRTQKDLEDSAQGYYTTNVRLISFDWVTLENATNKFSPSNAIGTDRWGIFYEAVLSTGNIVAVKRTSYTEYGHNMFKTELSLLSQLQHPNIMKLMGYLIDRKEMLLVYEFVNDPKTSLEAILFERKHHLDWMIRFKMIKGIAQGLEYLHQNSDWRKLYCHLRPHNIFIDSHMNPKIAFNLRHRDQQIGSTPDFVINDYATPESSSSEPISVESDIYIFGIIVLQIVSGRKHRLCVKNENLINYVRDKWNKEMALYLTDDSLGRDFIKEQAVICIQVALLCTQEEHKCRPSMSHVVRVLEGVQPPDYMNLQRRQLRFIPSRSSFGYEYRHEMPLALRECLSG